MSIAVLASSIDGIEKYKELLASRTEVKSFVKIFLDVRHGWTVWYEASREIAVEKTPEIISTAAEITTSVRTKALGAAEAVVEVVAEVPQDSAEKGNTPEADVPAVEAAALKRKAVLLLKSMIDGKDIVAQVSAV